MKTHTRAQLRHYLVKRLRDRAKCTNPVELKLARLVARACMAQTSGWPVAMDVQVAWEMERVRRYRANWRKGSSCYSMVLDRGYYRVASSRPTNVYASSKYLNKSYNRYCEALRALK